MREVWGGEQQLALRCMAAYNNWGYQHLILDLFMLGSNQ
jgi:hypothetical protein